MGRMLIKLSGNKNVLFWLPSFHFDTLNKLIYEVRTKSGYTSDDLFKKMDALQIDYELVPSTEDAFEINF